MRAKKKFSQSRHKRGVHLYQKIQRKIYKIEKLGSQNQKYINKPFTDTKSHIYLADIEFSKFCVFWLSSLYFRSAVRKYFFWMSPWSDHVYGACDLWFEPGGVRLARQPADRNTPPNAHRQDTGGKVYTGEQKKWERELSCSGIYQIWWLTGAFKCYDFWSDFRQDEGVYFREKN